MRSAPVSIRAADLIGLTQLMELSSGVPEVLVGLLDGPVSLDHPERLGPSSYPLFTEVRGR